MPTVTATIIGIRQPRIAPIRGGRSHFATKQSGVLPPSLAGSNKRITHNAEILFKTKTFKYEFSARPHSLEVIIEMTAERFYMEAKKEQLGDDFEEGGDDEDSDFDDANGEDDEW